MRSLQEAISSPTAGIDRWIVLVHGILSDHEDFETMATKLESPPAASPREVLFYDYRWRQPIIESAEEFADHLDTLPGYIRVTLVAHSMGSLVSRFALMRHGRRQVDRLVMLGGPHFGALRPAGLARLAHATLLGTGRLASGFAHPGLRDLTEPWDVFRAYARDLDRRGTPYFENVREVEYVTIPGEYWHPGRQRTSGLRKSLGTRGTLTLKALEAVEFLSGLIPGFRIELERPHDGIVEESSARLIPFDNNRSSEKVRALKRGHPTQRYIHVRGWFGNDVDHLRLVTDPTVLGLVRDLVDATSIQDWEAGLTADDRDQLTLSY